MTDADEFYDNLLTEQGKGWRETLGMDKLLTRDEGVADEAIRRLREEQANGDIEIAHSNADDILCNLLTELGFEDVVAEYAKVRKWYA